MPCHERYIAVLLLALLAQSSAFVTRGPLMHQAAAASIRKPKPTFHQGQERTASSPVAFFSIPPFRLRSFSFLFQATNDDGDDFGSAEDMATSGSSQDDEDEDDEFLHIPTKIPTEESPKWELGNDFEIFLNQCTIQSFLFLLKTCRDPQTVLWVEGFTQPAIRRLKLPINATQQLPAGGTDKSKLLFYHGLGAMNTTIFPTWDTYFRKLLEQPVTSHIIESWEAHIPDYEMEINPPSLCTRMISVREQIAKEFTKDLSVIANMNVDGLTKQFSSAEDPLRSEKANENLIFLEFDPDEDSDYLPSPLRKGNFDLLLSLTTQESIHRILNHDDETMQIELSQSSRQYLSNFYLNRLVSHFTGRQWYGRAAKFLQELVLSPPQMDDDSESAVALVDPTEIAKTILRMRQIVASEWSQIASEIPDRHMEIKRLQFDLLMTSYDKPDDAPFQ